MVGFKYDYLLIVSSFVSSFLALPQASFAHICQNIDNNYTNTSKCLSLLWGRSFIFRAKICSDLPRGSFGSRVKRSICRRQSLMSAQEFPRRSSTRLPSKHNPIVRIMSVLPMTGFFLRRTESMSLYTIIGKTIFAGDWVDADSRKVIFGERNCITV